MLKHAIILAGGFGTRLQSVVKELPKPMAPVAGRPFLEWVLLHCKSNGIKYVTLSVGYLSETIIEHFGNSFEGVQINYAIEKEPLGTGGAIRLAMEALPEEELVLVLNGDTLFKGDAQALAQFYLTEGADMAIALCRMYDFDRYGLVDLEGNSVRAFQEKTYAKEGLINAGVYVLAPKVLKAHFECYSKFSFEKDFMEALVPELNFVGLEQQGYFIDIGIPEDYEKAQKDLAN